MIQNVKMCARMAIPAVLLFAAACELDPEHQAEELAQRQGAAAGNEHKGFFSPIHLPPLAKVDPAVCLEAALVQDPAGTFKLDGEQLVDLGIFHIHDGVEHTNTADSCFQQNKCGPAAAREAHIPLGTQACKNGVLAKPFNNDAVGRKKKADALLGCAKAVVSFAVCLAPNSNVVNISLGDIWGNNKLPDGSQCYNLGGPTGSHADHPLDVRWFHLREYCGEVTGKANLITVSNEANKLHVGMTASCDIADNNPKGKDMPLCGTPKNPLQGNCDACGKSHQRCCDVNKKAGPGERQHYFGEGHPGVCIAKHECKNGRCLPELPEWKDACRVIQKDGKNHQTQKGERYCFGGHSMQCTSGNFEVKVEDCGNLGCDDATGYCNPFVCPGVGAFCVKGKEYLCLGQGVAPANPVEDCGKRGCDAAGQHCVPECPLAKRGMNMCHDNDVYYCDEDGALYLAKDCKFRGCDNATDDCELPGQCAAPFHGTQHCIASTLYVCDAQGDLTTQECATLCNDDGTACNEMECANGQPGDMYCEDDYVMFCSERGQEIQVADCQETSCDFDTLECVPPPECDPFAVPEHFCYANDIYSCTANSTLQLEANCAPGICDPVTATCVASPVCPFGSGISYCHEGNLWTCNGDGQISLVADCGGSGCDELIGACAVSTFTCEVGLPGGEICIDGAVHVCELDGTLVALPLACSDVVDCLLNPEHALCVSVPVDCALDPANPACNAFAISHISPTAIEPGSLTTITLHGMGFEPWIQVSVAGASLWNTTAISPSSVLVHVQAPPFATTIHIAITLPNTPPALPQTQVVSVDVLPGFCGGVQCGSCQGDADCLDGDKCTLDQCVGNQCLHTMLESCCPIEGCDVCTLNGDVTQTGTVGVADALCGILLSQWFLTGGASAPPSCVARPFQTLDYDCNGMVDVSDVQFLILYRVMGQSLPNELDSDFDGCHDGCGGP